MTDPRTTMEEPTGSDAPAPPPEAESTGPLVEAELLVEDISIDGMCGVY